LFKEFPERPGALIKFLRTLRPGQNISLFHYRNHGSGKNSSTKSQIVKRTQLMLDGPDTGKILAGIQVPKGEEDMFLAFMNELRYPHVEETDNPVYRNFMHS